MKCRHLVISDEAYQNGAPAAAFLCAWPQTMGVTPTWVDKQIGGGVRIDHRTECAECPCFERQEQKP